MSIASMLGAKGQNLSLGRSQDYTIRELQCGTCHKMLFAIVTEHPASVDLIWPFAIECRGTEHVIVQREVMGDANVTCHGKAADKAAIIAFLERFL